MDRIKTATGREFDCVYFNPSPSLGRIYIRVVNTTISNAAMVFSDPKETAQLWCEGEYVAQYTKLVSIVPEGNAIRIVLRKE